MVPLRVWRGTRVCQKERDDSAWCEIAGRLEADHLRDPLEEPIVGALTLCLGGGAQRRCEGQRGLHIGS